MSCTTSCSSSCKVPASRATTDRICRTNRGTYREPNGCAHCNTDCIANSGTDRGTPGNDSLDWKPIVAALKKIGYKQEVVIESFTTDVKVIARAAAIWRAMEPRRDDIAVKGLKNLHRFFGRKK